MLIIIVMLIFITSTPPANGAGWLNIIMLIFVAVVITAAMLIFITMAISMVMLIVIRVLVSVLKYEKYEERLQVGARQGWTS